MYWVPFVILVLSLAVIEFKLGKSLIRYILAIVISAGLTTATVAIDYQIQTTDVEVWSGRVVDWNHEEEWDEWIPPVTTCTTDAKGLTSCSTTPGYWVHHSAKNHVKTSDNGWIYVNTAPDGTVFNDNYPNDVTPLMNYFPKDIPTASAHTYTNKVQASYSIYRHKEIDLSEFPDLPEYPSIAHDYFFIDRVLGFVPNKDAAIKRLDEHNSELNKMVPDKEKEGKLRSYKQVNIIFVNVGENKPESYGLALQDKWENGNKNDFVVSFSMDSNGKLKWVYPFSWSEVEILKLEVRDYMMELDQVNDFNPVIDKVAQLVEEKYERKQFADFNYLHIDTSTTATVIVWMINIIIIVMTTWSSVGSYREKYRWRKWHHF